MTAITRRGFVGLTALAIAGAATGCGRQSKTEGGASGSAAPAIAEGKATGSLTVWAMGAEGEKLPALIKDFTAANPDCKVTVTPIPWDSAHDKFTSAIAGGTTPDLAQVGSTWMGEFVGLGALDQVPSNIDNAKFFEGAQKTNVVDGATYGVPWYVETRCVYYRKDLATKAGITETPTDWDGLKALAKAYKEKAGAKVGLNLQPGGQGAWQTYAPMMWSNGGKLMSEDAKTFTLDDPKNVEALTYYQSYFTEGLANKAISSSPAEADFANGVAPMFISGPWMMAAVEKAGGGDSFKDKYGVFTMPKKESSASFVGGANLGVFKNTKNRDAAWKLVQFLTEKETQLKWYKSSTDLPSVKDAWEDPSLKSDEKLSVFGEQLKTAYAPPSIGTWEQVAGKMDAQVEKVCKSGLAPAEALKTAQTEATSIGIG
ncbi:sugar ABC transporter substrate-binding protein [Luteococcus sp. H138]|uniref:sugar ABC transporter substrate-binding protein n=1 Tax=unclassified Luteococcus TaxID=2639923 RepID=UPI00313DC1F7